MFKFSDGQTPYIWHLTLKVDLYLSLLKMFSSMRYTCMPNIKLLSWILKYCKSVHKISDFDPYILPLTLKDDLDLNLSPLKMCSFMRYICMPNIKLLSSILQKLLQMLKLAQTNQPTNRPTNQQTNRQGKNNMSPTTIVGDIISEVFLLTKAWNDSNITFTKV